jgi:hypothetical protein
VVSRQVIDPVWYRSPQLLDQKVVHPHLLWLPFRSPLAATILEVADELLLFGVDGDDRLLPSKCGADQLVDVAELLIPIRMAVALASLAISLQTEALFLQQLADDCTADRVALRMQLGFEPTQAFARPAQPRLRITACGRLHQSQQSIQQSRVSFDQRPATPAGVANQPGWRSRAVGKFPQRTADRARRYAGRTPDGSDSAVSGGLRLRCRKHPATPFIQMRPQGHKSCPNRFVIYHSGYIRRPKHIRNPSSPKYNVTRFS